VMKSDHIRHLFTNDLRTD